MKVQYWDQIKLGTKPKYSWKEAAVKWVSESTKKSISDDIYNFSWLDHWLSDLTLCQIDQRVIEIIITAKLNEGTSNARVNRITSLVGAILNKAKNEWGWIDSVPTIRKLKESKQRIRWLTQKEAVLLLSELPEHLNAVARFALSTGLRESNITLLEWSQIDMQRKVCWIHPDQAKAGRAIGVPLNDSAINVLHQQIGKHHIRVFTYKGKPFVKAGTRAFKNALERSGINNFRFHDLRHTWASWHVQSGTPLNVLQELGGWSSYEMVQRYAHLAPEYLANHANCIDTFLSHSDKQTIQKTV